MKHALLILLVLCISGCSSRVNAGDETIYIRQDAVVPRNRPAPSTQPGVVSGVVETLGDRVGRLVGDSGIGDFVTVLGMYHLKAGEYPPDVQTAREFAEIHGLPSTFAAIDGYSRQADGSVEFTVTHAELRGKLILHPPKQ
jgi:hypothetical protein